MNILYLQEPEIAIQRVRERRSHSEVLGDMKEHLPKRIT